MTLPTQMWAAVPSLSEDDAVDPAFMAVEVARFMAPKLTGDSSASFIPLVGEGQFGIGWEQAHVWYQDQGTRPFTMTSLAGKTIPMWIDDPTGKERADNPKAKTRTTASGKTQVLIFRRAANIGQRKTVDRPPKGLVNVPASYPGAPGRIAKRHVGKPDTMPGKIGGHIAAGNVGVRWRNPGLHGRHFLEFGLREAARSFHLVPSGIFAIDAQGTEKRRVA